MEASFEANSRELYAASHANEPGLLRYEYWRGHEPRTYYTLLAFKDHAAFLTHQASDHHRLLTADLGEMVEDVQLEFVDPIDGASPLPAADTTTVIETSSPLIEHYAARYPATIEPWWDAQR